MSSSLPETVKEFQNSKIENINSYRDLTSCSLPSFKSRSTSLTYEKLLNACEQTDVLKIIDDIYNIDITSFGVCDKNIFNRVSNNNSSNLSMDTNYAIYINNALCNLYLIKYLLKKLSFNEEQINYLKKWSKQELLTNIFTKEKEIQALFTKSAVEVNNDRIDLESLTARLKALSGGSRSKKRRSKKRRSKKRRGTKQRQQGIKRRTKSRH